MVSVLDVAALLLRRLGPMDSWKLQKLCYYSQAWHLALTDAPLFSETIEAWPDGPVAKELWRSHRNRRIVSEVPAGNARAIEQRDVMLIDLICDHYGQLSGPDLVDMTHSERPWLQTRDGLQPRERSSRPISRRAMSEFYRGRELAGHAAADIIASGLWLPAEVTDSSIDEELDEIRADFTSEPGHPPDQEDVVSAQFVTAPHHVGVPTGRQRVRPRRRGQG